MNIYTEIPRRFYAQDILSLGPDKFGLFVHLMCGMGICERHPFDPIPAGFAVSKSGSLPLFILNSTRGYGTAALFPPTEIELGYRDTGFGYLAATAPMTYSYHMPKVACLPQSLQSLRDPNNIGIATVDNVLTEWCDFNREAGLSAADTYYYDLAVDSWREHYEELYSEMPTEYLVSLGHV